MGRGILGEVFGEAGAGGGGGGVVRVGSGEVDVGAMVESGKDTDR